jgi:hypothetical protein
LPRSCVALLQGKHFEVQEAGNCVDRIYESLQTDSDTKLWLGRNITSTLFENTSDYFQSPEAFSRMVKVSTPLNDLKQDSHIRYSMHICLISLQTPWQCYLPIQIRVFSLEESSVKSSGTCRHSECKHLQ